MCTKASLHNNIKCAHAKLCLNYNIKNKKTYNYVLKSGTHGAGILASHSFEFADFKMKNEHLAAIKETVFWEPLIVALGIPSQRRLLTKECETKPRAPTSIVKNVTDHLLLLICSNRERYLASLLILAARVPSSAGHVNSKRITFCNVPDHMIMSGLWSVSQISIGKTMFWLSKSTSIFQSEAPTNKDLLLTDFLEPARISWPAFTKRSESDKAGHGGLLLI